MKTKTLLIVFIYTFLLLQNLFSQENWATTSTGNNVPSSRGYHTAIWTGTPTNKMIIWGGYAGNISVQTGGIYDPVLNIWSATSTTNAPTARILHTAIWTGTKMIVWGGNSNFVGQAVFNTGGIYDPVLNIWTATSTSGAPAARFQHTAVWTGSKMIVWGGDNGSPDHDTLYNTGGIYDPVTNSWTAMSTINAPTGRREYTAVWTGSKMIIWGGTGLLDSVGYTTLNTGGIYDPVLNSWAVTSTGSNCPTARRIHTAVWAGTKMIVWGGVYNGGNYNDGGIYDPVTDTWTATSTSGAPIARVQHTAVWTGSRMIVWGGHSGNLTNLNTGGIYDPLADTWAATTTVNAPIGRFDHTAVITQNSMIVWGGYIGNNVYSNTGGIYTNPPVIGITPISTEIPQQFSLSQNYPNPFNPNSKIKFQIAKSGFAKLAIFDILGREVSILVNEQLKPGTYEVDFDGSKFASGVYFYKLIADGFIETKKMILTK